MPALDEKLTIDSQRLASLLEEKAPVHVLDVRPAKEREEWHIPGSVHVDAYEALKRNDPHALTAVDLPDDRPIVVVCGAGKTSLTAAEQLRSRGKNAVSLEGGMKAWSQAFNTAEVPSHATSARILQVRRTGKGCLSYLVGDDGEAAVIDAALDPAVYLRLAEARGWRITHVLDTHIHADHLSRSRALAEEAGARLLLPAQERIDFPHVPVADGDTLTIGSARLRAIRTPGHTGESTSLLLDTAAVFTGDTLFIDGVGRPDLETGPEEARAQAAALYDSIHRLLAEVPSSALVLPGHESRPIPFDGRPVGETLAVVRDRIATLSLPKDDFVEHLLARIPPTPPNYELIVELNEAGATSVENILDLEAGANRCAVS